MKIGILTYQRAHNYGALLQAYALKTFLAKKGHSVEIIDYWPEYHNEDYKLIPYFSSRRFLGKIKALLLLLLGYDRIVKRKNGYKAFMKSQLNLSDKPLYLLEKDMDSLSLDVVVYGSDQIWRRSNYPIFKGFSDVYFGAYPKNVKRKITYAASMGVIDVNEKDKDYFKLMLKNFDSISVRESNLKQLVEEVIKETVSLVLDPVFLLGKEEWIKISPQMSENSEEKYIFFYQLTPSKEAIEYVNLLKEYYGYKVIEIRGRVEPLLFGARYFQRAGPIDFISLIKNAEIVVSTSFHGVAFSIIFEKQFYSLGLNNNSARVQTVLDELGISERLVDKIDQVDYADRIDYEKVNKRMLRWKLHSQNYLIDL